MNVYDRLLEINDSNDLITKMEDEITQKLSKLLYDSCNIDLSNIDVSFKQKEISRRDGIDIHIKYVAGFVEATLLLLPIENKLEVEFFFSKNSYIKDFYYKAKDCYLDIDNDMLLKSSKINNSFLFVEKNSNHFFNSFLRIDTCINNKHNFSKKFEHTNLNSFKKDLKDFGLSSYFYFNNQPFEDLLTAFLFHAANHSLIFFDLFDEYPKSVDLIHSAEKMVQFLELFKHQYLSDPDLLKSRILLMKMNTI